jgi:hypothetical protein
MVSTKSESTITNLVTDLHFNAPLIGSQRQAQAIYLDLINAFDHSSYSLLMD